MAITGNKGEWSEIYTLFKLLGDGKVYAGDAMLNKMNVYYPIIDIIRQESNRIDYQPDETRQIVIIDKNGTQLLSVPMSRFTSEAESLFGEITSAKGASFTVPATETFMKSIGCNQLKAKSTDKADIHIVIHDLRTGMKPELGFSIKSQLGSASTLLNAGSTTNIVYRIKGVDLTNQSISDINSIEDHLGRMKHLDDLGGILQFEKIDNEVFRNNLLFIDSSLPQFIAECLSISSGCKGILPVVEVVKCIAERNPFGFTGSDVENFYAHKMKMLLLDVALGMTPAKEWLGQYDANGGYLVVRQDGEIVCYHFYNRNDVEDYLFYNTRFERASRSRYDYGSLYRGEDGVVRIKLNLQIRFKK